MRRQITKNGDRIIKFSPQLTLCAEIELGILIGLLTTNEKQHNRYYLRLISERKQYQRVLQDML